MKTNMMSTNTAQFSPVQIDIEPDAVDHKTLMELAETKAYDAILNSYQNYPSAAIAEVADWLRCQDIYNVALPLYQYVLQQQVTADIYFGLGQCYGKTYQYQVSLIYLQQAFQLESDRTEGANYYAYILERNGLMEPAEQWYRKALRGVYNDDLWTLSHYAYFLEKYNQPAAAELAYQTVLELNPNYTWAVKRYALFLLKQNQPERSLKLMQAAIAQFSNPFVQLNYLEYLMIRGDGSAYEAHLRSLNYSQLSLPFQTLIDLFDYFWRYLLQKQSNSEKLAAYQQQVKKLQDSIHRDFDDLNDLLIAKGGDLATWQHLTQLLVK